MIEADQAARTARARHIVHHERDSRIRLIVFPTPRAIISRAPPGAKATMTVISFLGKSAVCPKTPPVKAVRKGALRRPFRSRICGCRFWFSLYHLRSAFCILHFSICTLHWSSGYVPLNHSRTHPSGNGVFKSQIKRK